MEFTTKETYNKNIVIFFGGQNCREEGLKK